MAKIYDFSEFRAAKQFEAISAGCDDVKSKLDAQQRDLTLVGEKIGALKVTFGAFGREVACHRERLETTLALSEQCLQVCETGSPEDMVEFREQMQKKAGRMSAMG